LSPYVKGRAQIVFENRVLRRTLGPKTDEEEKTA
jgi:hypothetical protein